MKKTRISLIATITALLSILSQTAIITHAVENDSDDRIKDLIELDGAKEESYELSGADALLYSDIPVSSFEVSNLSPDIVTDLDYTDWWYSEWDDCRYIFLPVTADRDSLVISYCADDTVKLNGVPVQSGEMTALLGDADSFQITVGDTYCGTLKIMQSNIGCIYLSTSHVGTDALDNDRSITETGTAFMLNAEGVVEYSGTIEKLTAHGNSSWDYSKKKTYMVWVRLRNGHCFQIISIIPCSETS